MNQYEFFNLSVSVVSVMVATLAVVASYRTAKKQQQLAQRTHALEVRSCVATHHAKYSELLFDVQSSVDEQKRLLVEAAGRALEDLHRIFNKYSTRGGERLAGEIYGELCRLAYEALLPDLNWQNGLYLGRRFVTFRHAEDRLTVLKAEMPKSKAAKRKLDFRKIKSKNPNAKLEWVVIESHIFRLLMLDFCTAVNIDNEKGLIVDALVAIASFEADLRKVEPALEVASKRLDEGLLQNDLEEFPLYESPALYSEFMRERQKLDVLSNIWMFNAKSLLRDFHPLSPSIPSIADFIYAGGLLETFSLFVLDDLYKSARPRVVWQ